MSALLDRLTKVLPLDKLEHICVGIGIGAFLLVAFALERHLWPAFFAAHVGFFGIINGGAAVHISKEGEDWLDNRQAKREGRPPEHGVELLDAIAGECGTLLVAGIGLWAGLL